MIIEVDEFDEKEGKFVKRKYKVIEKKTVKGGIIKVLQPYEG